jgi:hypothetical protein
MSGVEEHQDVRCGNPLCPDRDKVLPDDTYLPEFMRAPCATCGSRSRIYSVGHDLTIRYRVLPTHSQAASATAVLDARPLTATEHGILSDLILAEQDFAAAAHDSWSWHVISEIPGDLTKPAAAVICHFGVPVDTVFGDNELQVHIRTLAAIKRHRHDHKSD